ncbi:MULTISPECIES: hypothetical protein [Streptomyces]|uniref:hypothetical protein n=1 Tax=Streptomyces TaxID=1883 RepID=UPI0006FFF317|nr:MULTISPECIES: hypothetical protein [Streptomyces]KQZ19767.1 hypothetical protein ASD51_25970 [Streptomyces sp. Root55]MDX3063523.1 hypothetical protein [Streptomyces sp. ND04-05B]RPK85823.1 hypothetical protein EES45_01590 [Streptomyces sp. ADI97-07]WRY85886.1 hypothetical protein OG388_33960 [Streptomyces clavifer]WUC31598.1 hypothetical protein OG927_31515 [Streptomyces clavifer]
MIKNRSLRRIGTLAGTLSAAVLLTVTQASAASAETERATATTGPSSVDSWECAGIGGNDRSATVCYSALGDWFYLYDGKSDGYSAVVDWEIRDGQNRVVRYGATFNADGVGAVRYKNKDFPDGSNDSIRFRACLGNWGPKTIKAGSCSGWMTRST